MEKIETISYPDISNEMLSEMVRKRGAVADWVIKSLRATARVTPTTPSWIDNEVAIRWVIAEKIRHIAKKTLNGNPINFCSIQQLIWGGKHWNDCEDERMRYGILNHLGFNQNNGFYHHNGRRRPTNKEQVLSL